MLSIGSCFASNAMHSMLCIRSFAPGIAQAKLGMLMLSIACFMQSKAYASIGTEGAGHALHAQCFSNALHALCMHNALHWPNALHSIAMPPALCAGTMHCTNGSIAAATTLVQAPLATAVPMDQRSRAPAGTRHAVALQQGTCCRY